MNETFIFVPAQLPVSTRFAYILASALPQGGNKIGLLYLSLIYFSYIRFIYFFFFFMLKEFL